MSSRTTPATPAPRKASKRAVCVGINDYPFEGNDLNGCVNDAHAWADLLTQHFGFASPDVKLLLDGEATKQKTLDAFKDLLAGAQPGDVLVFTNSSHGSYIADKDGDEETYDQIICPYDIRDNQIVDDELRELIHNLRDGVRLALVLDNCFSGTATRAIINEGIPGLMPPDDRRVRFLNPKLRGLPELRNPWAAKPKAKAAYPESKMKEILLSGCTNKEYSYDASIGGVYHGAMTYYAIQAIRQANYRLTYAQLSQRLVNTITDYPQHPQLEGKTKNKKQQIFA
jgi:metacaspase-1